jgi:hypothetical protein
MNEDNDGPLTASAFDEREREARLANIWADDLLDRRSEALDLEEYLCARFGRLNDETNDGAFTIAVDAMYGEGKSYFLGRLGDQLKISHPVASINAWSDDTSDEPLTALFVAIEDALTDREPQNKPTPMWLKFRSNSTKLLALAGKAGLKGLAARVITKEGLEEFSDAASDLMDDVYDRWAVEESETFRKRRELISTFKDSLKSRIDEIESMGVIRKPAFIIVDELDRCRPTYAIRMLEEIKHLFDYTGVVFILGTSINALLPSIKAVYGSEFDAREYLHRFVRRTYHLETPSLAKIVFKELSKTNVDLEKLQLFNSDPTNLSERLEYFSNYIAEIMRANKRTARDIDHVAEYIFSFVALWPHQQKIQLGFLLPMILQHHFSIGEFKDSPFTFNYRTPRGQENFGYIRLFQMFDNRSNWNFNDIYNYEGWLADEYYIRHTLNSEGSERSGNIVNIGITAKNDPRYQKTVLNEYRDRVNRVRRTIG